jgi:hypothetical protein
MAKKKEDCGCKKKTTKPLVRGQHGKYTYTELEKVYNLMKNSNRTQEETDQIWELYNRIFWWDKQLNKRCANCAGKVGRNLQSLYEQKRLEKDEQTKRRQEAKDVTSSSDSPKKRTRKRSTK